MARRVSADRTAQQAKKLEGERERWKNGSPEWRAKQLENQRRFWASPKGRALSKKRNAERVFSEEERAHRRAYQKAYNASAHGKAKVAARNARPEKRVRKAARRKANRQSEKGREKERVRAIAKAHRRRVALGAILSPKVVAAVCSARVCYYCGVGIEPMRGIREHACKATLDHRIPVVRGGTNDRENLVSACLDCNSRKRDLTDAEFLASM